MHAVDALDQPRRHIRYASRLELVGDDFEVVATGLTPALTRRADRHPGKHAIVPGLHRLPAVDNRVRGLPDQRAVTHDRLLDAERFELQAVEIPADENGAVADRATAGQIVYVQRELTLLDIHALGNDSLDHHARCQTRHRQMGGFLRARLVPVHRAGYVVGSRVSLGNFLAVRVANDEPVDVELLEGGIEVELQRAEIRNALCVLHLDLLQQCPRQGVTAVERIAGDAVQEPSSVAFDHCVARGAIDQ